MFKKLTPVSKERHARTRVKPIESFGFAAEFQVASLMVNEFTRAATIYPLVFIEDAEKSRLVPVALLGLEAGENLFVDTAGRWQASYIPAIIRRYPFALADTGQAGKLTVCIDEQSPLVNEAVGEPLFDGDGEATTVIENVKRYLGELQQMDTLTKNFCNHLREHDLVTPLTMQVRQAERVRNIAGCHVVNQKRLDDAADEAFLDLRRRGYLPPIYAHLVSLAQLERLVMLKEERAGGMKGVHPTPAHD